MGTLSQGILGPMKNKTGPVVGFVWKGINALRSYNESPANPRTAAQVANRDVFTQVQAMASELLTTIVKPLWDRFASRMSGYNAFISANFANFSATLPADLPNIVIARGSLTGVDNLACSGSNASPTVVVTWNDNTGTGTALGTDEAYIVVFNETQAVYGISSAAVDRSAATANVTMPANCVTADELHCWMAFRKVDGTLVSNTAYDADTV